MKKNNNSNNSGIVFLKQLNKRFYNLIIDLNKYGFIQTSEITAFAYEHFWKELNQHSSINRLN